MMGVLPDWAIKRDIKITPFAEGVKRSGEISYGLTSYGYDIRLGYKFRVFTNTWCGVIDPKAYDPKAFVEVEVDPTHNWIPMKWADPKEGDCEYDKCSYCGKEEHKDEHGYEQGRPNTCDKAINYVTIPPNSFLLGESLETFDIPRDVLCIALGKSTYARCGIVANVTPGEPEWVGKWTIELSNTTPLPAKVYAGEGICQMIFLRTDGYRELNTGDIRHLYGTNYVEEFAAAAMKSASCQVSYKDKAGKYQDQPGMTSPKVDGK